MKRQRGRLGAIAAVMALAACFQATAADRVGEATYVDGQVDLFRAGQQLAARDVGIGSAVENYDIIRTARNGTFEINLTAGPAADSSIRVDPNTSFTVEVGKVKGQPQTTVNMISGTLSLKVRKMTGGGGVDVKTESAVMAVRGTEFSVTTPPSGDILITCTEGSVSCRDESGTELHASPGTAVEKIAGERFRTVPVAVSSIKAFQSQWNTDRISSLRSNAARAIQNYATRYDELTTRFDREYRSLMSHAEVLNAWAEEESRGETPSGLSSRSVSEKKQLIGSLLRLRTTLFVFERVYFRLVELEEYHRDGYGRGKLAGGGTTDEFFTRFAAERTQLAKRLSRVQFAARLYARRNDGEFPAGLLGGEGGDEGWGEEMDLEGDWSDD
jgi:hypothetical protein